MSEKHSERHDRKHLTNDEINQPVHEGHEGDGCDHDKDEEGNLRRPASQPNDSGEPDPGH